MYTDEGTGKNDRIIRLIENMEQDLRALRHLVAGSASQPAAPAYFHPGSLDGSTTAAEDEQAIEGIFDGERMVDANGKGYQVSANYASKSKLIEGDPLKLYITPDGKFFYKQLGPIPRKTIPGTLRAEGNHYVVDSDEGQTYNVLTASVTYYISLYGINAGDRVMLMVPADRPATWGVIDNVL